MNCSLIHGFKHKLVLKEDIETIARVVEAQSKAHSALLVRCLELFLRASWKGYFGMI